MISTGNGATRTEPRIPQTVGEQDAAALWEPRQRRSPTDQRGIESIGHAVEQMLFSDFVTLSQRSNIWELHTICTPVETIARRLRLSESDVRRVIAEGRDDV